MKRQLLPTWILFLAVIGTQSVSASPALSLGTVRALPGQTVTLGLCLSGATTPCAGVNAKIILPATVSLLGVEKGGMLNAGTFATDYRTYPGGCTIIAYSGSDTFRGTDGVLLRLRLNVASNTTAGPKTLSFAPSNPPGVNSKYALSDATGDHSITPTPVNGQLIVDADSDHDNMGDSWETTQFGSLGRDGTLDWDGDGISDATEYADGTNPKLRDSDGDGLTDAEELIAGTCATDPGDCFAISDAGVVSSTGPFVLYWDSKPGRLYSIYSSTNLLSGWSFVVQVPGDGTRKTYSNSESLNPRYFQLKVEEQ